MKIPGQEHMAEFAGLAAMRVKAGQTIAVVARKLGPVGQTLRGLLAALLFGLSLSHSLAQPPNTAAAPSREQTAPQDDLRQLTAGTVFRECADCPQVVVIVPKPKGLESLQRDNVFWSPEQTPEAIELPGLFAIGRYEVTRAEFARFVKDSGYAAPANVGCYGWNGTRYATNALADWRKPGFAQTENDPAVCVSWSDANAYTEWLAKKTGKPYRLPSEADWEYAARAGHPAARPWGDSGIDACRHANVADASTKQGVSGTAGSWKYHDCDDRHAYTAPVGSYPPNAFGLHDMLGNAWEWTDTCWNPAATGTPSAEDRVTGPCEQRVLRGGGWVDSPAYVRYDFRFLLDQGDRDFYSGFRVLRGE